MAKNVKLIDPYPGKKSQKKFLLDTKKRTIFQIPKGFELKKRLKSEVLISAKSSKEAIKELARREIRLELEHNRKRGLI